MSAAAAIPLHAERNDPAPMHSAEAEMSVLGGMLVSPPAIAEVADLLEPEHFHFHQNRVLYRAMLELDRRGTPIEPVTLSDHLRSSGEFDSMGGIAYLAQLWDYVPSAANIEYHARIVLRHATRRRLMAGAAEVQQLVREMADADPETLQAEAERILADAAVKSSGPGPVLVKDLLWPEMERLEDMQKHPDAPLGIMTGLESLDDRLGGLQPGQLVVIAGRPSMGKSALGITNLAADAAIRQGIRTAVFSVESTKPEVTRRLLSSEARVDLQAARKRRNIRDDEYPRLAQAAGLLNAAPLHIDHTPGMTLDQMRVKLRSLVHDHGPIGLAVVDYLQMMSHPAARNRYDEVSAISRGLKRIAQEFELVMVALSQLSRKVEERPSRVPVLSDLRESGQVEQDADVILLLFRPEYYFGATMSVGTGKNKRDENVEGRADVIVGKARDGQTGTARQTWEAEYTHFAEYRGDYRGGGHG